MATKRNSRSSKKVSEPAQQDSGGFTTGLINFILILLSIMGLLYVMDPSLGLVKTVGMWIVAAFVALMGQLLAGNVLKLGGRWVTVLSVLALFGVFLLVKNQYQNQKEPCRNFVTEPQILPADISRNEVLVVIADFFQVEGVDVTDDPDGNLFVQLNALADQINAEGTPYPVRVQMISSPAVRNEKDAVKVSDCLGASVTIFGEVSKGSIRYVTYTKSRAADHSVYSDYDAISHLTDERLSSYVLSGGSGPFVLNSIIGAFYVADKQGVKAEPYLTQAIQWAQNNPPVSNSSLASVYMSRSGVYLGQNLFDLALADASLFIQLEPENPVAYSYRALVYEFWVMAEPDQSFWQVSNSGVYSTDYRLDLALADTEKAISIYPDFKEAIATSGTILGWQGKYDLGLERINRAIELDPSDPRTYVKRANLYQIMHLYDLENVDRETAKRLGYESTVNP